MTASTACAVAAAAYLHLDGVWVFTVNRTIEDGADKVHHIVYFMFCSVKLCHVLVCHNFGIYFFEFFVQSVELIGVFVLLCHLGGQLRTFHVEFYEEGAVSDVFSSPKSEAAKRLVYPEGYQNPVMSGEDGTVIRVVFNGANATETPLIAKMAIEENIAASILSASTRSIGDKAYGNMLLGISGGGEQTQRALDYLGSIPDIFVEEVKQ